MSDSLPANARQEPAEPDPDASGRSDRARSTRRALLAAAAEQFAEVGYHRTSLSAVLARAGVTKGALYFHFTSKQDLAEAVVQEMVSIWRMLVAESKRRPLDPLRALVAQVDDVVQRLVDDPVVRGATRLLGEASVAPPGATDHYSVGETAAAELLVRAREAGLLRPGVDIPRVARLVVAAIAGHRLICDTLGRRTELPERVADMWDALLPAVASDAWLEGWNRGHRPRCRR